MKTKIQTQLKNHKKIKKRKRKKQIMIILQKCLEEEAGYAKDAITLIMKAGKIAIDAKFQKIH